MRRRNEFPSRMWVAVCLQTPPFSDPFFYHSLIEAQKFAYAQRTHLGDVDFVPEAYELAKNMTTAEYTAAILDRFVWKAMPSAYYGNNVTAQVGKHLHNLVDSNRGLYNSKSYLQAS